MLVISRPDVTSRSGEHATAQGAFEDAWFRFGAGEADARIEESQAHPKSDRAQRSAPSAE